MEFETKQKLLKDLFESALKKYNDKSCSCAYPRFRQIIAIDCVDTGDTFSCFETELLISMSKINFDIEKVNSNIEKWVCKKCESTYTYEWQDFNIALNRQCLKLTELKITEIGKDILKPIPLFIGLFGYSYPSKTIIVDVDFNTFEKYMMEN
jgi:hypothetical protein